MTPVEAIERTTALAVARRLVEPAPGWLVTLDPGYIGRARCATPLAHEPAPDPGIVDRIVALFEDAGLPPAFRLTDAAGHDWLKTELTARGYAPEQPTLVKTGTTEGLIAVAPGAAAELIATPDADWRAVFIAEKGEEGASRAAALAASPDTAYARVVEAGRTLAVGAAAFAHGWACINGMRTLAERRGEGLAGRVLKGLALAARARGIAQVFLSVEEPNGPARSLYRRAGMSPAWRYAYWRRP